MLCALANVNSLINKTRYINDFLLINDIDILAVTETWLTSSIPNSFVNIHNYDLVRTDTTGSVMKHGVCLYVKNGIHFVSVDISCPNVHAIFLPTFKIYIVAVYRPPSYTVAENAKLIDFIADFGNDKEVIFLGDFNLPSIKWGADDIISLVQPNDALFFNCFTSLGLTQWIKEPTFLPSGNILDLILTSESDRIGSLDVLSPFPQCHHTIILFQYVFQFHSLDNAPGTDELRSLRAWHKGKYARIRDHLSCVDWDYELAHLSVNDKYLKFLNILTPLINLFVPPKHKVSSPPWPTKPPIILINARKEAWSSYKNLRSMHGRLSPQASDALVHFNNLNYQYRNYSISSQSQYELSLIDSFNTNPKLLHSYVRHKKVGQPCVGPLVTREGVMTNDCKAMADVFVKAFASVYQNQNLPNPGEHQSCDSSISDIVLDLSTVKQYLKSLDIFSSMGPDGIHPHLLQSCADQLAYPLYLIFKASLSSGLLPNLWKVSNVVPIFKKGSRTIPLNYRPISLTSVCVKTLERIVTNQLYQYLEDNSIISDSQFGFRACHSTEDQLILTYHDITSWVDYGYTVDVVYFDFSKAFDVVHHDTLIHKLNALGISGSLLSWLRAFLQNRQMRVVVSGTESYACPVLSGVPQGSVLGPVLFIIYINHVVHDLSCGHKIFADDLKLYLYVNHQHTSSAFCDIAQLQQNISLVCSRSESWGLKFNTDKCAVLRFQRSYVDWTLLGPYSSYYINNIPIKFVQSYVDLGIMVDLSLRFHQHIYNITNKAGGLATNLLKSTVNRSPRFMKTLYISHIRPLLDYASCVWFSGYVEDLKLLESVQRRWTKNISGLEILSYSDRLKYLDLYSIQGRLLRADLIKYWKIFHGLSAIKVSDIFQLAPVVGTRGHSCKIFHPHSRLDCKKRFFSVRCIPVWNSLPADTVAASSLSSFKRLLHNAMGNTLYDYVE